jgi:hypothetical protein
VSQEGSLPKPRSLFSSAEVKVHSAASHEEVQAKAREAFGLQGEDECEIQRERPGPYAPRERVEIVEVKKRRGRA